MHGKVPFDEDNSDNWRFRHFKSFIVFCASTGSFDVAFAVFVLVHDAGVQSYVRYVAAAVSLVEASFIALVVALIFFHKGVDSHADMGPYLFLLWAASLSINITYYIGATSSDSLDDNVYIVGVILASLSQLSGLALSIVSRMLHILYLRDPNPYEHGWNPSTSSHGGGGGRRRHHRRHHWGRHRNSSDEEDD